MTAVPIGDALAEVTRRDPDAVAIRTIDPDDPARCVEVLTRAELLAAADRLAGRWMADGLLHDDVVAITLPNCAAFVVACAAAWRAGAIPFAVSADLPGVEDLIDRSGARVGVTDPGQCALDHTSGPSHRSGSPPASSWKLSASSGSTGAPKLIRAGSAAVVDPDQPATAFLPLHATQLVCGPMTHAAPFAYAMRGLMTGHELVLLRRFDPTAALRTIEQHGVTWLMLVPELMRRITAVPGHRDIDTSTLQTVVHLGARCPSQLKREWIDWLGPQRIVEVYAGTEAHGLTMIGGEEWLQHPGSVGQPIGGSQFRIQDTSGRETPPGRIGQVWMRRAPDPAPWHTMGDLGRLDAEGRLFIVDRSAHAFTVGTDLVYPADLEETLIAHPFVDSAVVTGLAAPGQVRALIQPAPAFAGTDDPSALEGAMEGAIEEWIADRLPAGLRMRVDIADADLWSETGKTRHRRSTPDV